MKKHLTDRTVKGLTTDKRQEDFWDDPGLPGCSFGIRVTSTGRKTWTMLYLDPKTRRKKRVKLGLYSSKVGLEKARAKALKTLAELADGKTPTVIAEKTVDTFADAAEDFLEIWPKARGLKPATVAEYRRQVETELIPRFGKSPLRAVTRREIAAFLDEVAFERGKGVMANRLKATLSAVFTFAVERERVDSNPCFRLPNRVEEKARERVLTEEEIRLLWEEWGRRSASAAGVYKLMLLTGCRSIEAKTLTWGRVDFNEETLTVPADVAKNGREHILPLPPSALSVLRELAGDPPKTEGYVFASEAEAGHLTWMQRTTERVRAAVRKKDGMADFHFTPHDLRRTAATHMSRLGVDDGTIGRILNHGWVFKNMTTGVYNRDRRLPEMRRALDKWDSALRRIVSGEAGKVVAFR
jgi:integrase